MEAIEDMIQLDKTDAETVSDSSLKKERINLFHVEFKIL